MAIGLIQLKQIQGLGQIDSNTDPTFNSVTIEQDGIGANLSDGVILSNLQPADSINTIQYSPLLRLTGTAWDNTGSEQDDWIIVNEPVNGSGITTSNLIIASQINGGGYNTQLTLTSNGVLSAITLNLTNSLGVTYGGTSLSSYTKGDIIYASNTNVLSKLGIGTNGQILWIASGIPAWTAQTSITSLGTVTVGTWNASVIGATYGGTGVNNGSYTITLGGNISTGGALTFSGAYSTTITVTGATTITLPTSGTLVNTSVTTLSSLASIGTITTGVWNAGSLTNSVASIGTGITTYGLSLINPTLATAGVTQQWSPAIFFKSYAYYSGASHEFDWGISSQPAVFSGGSILKFTSYVDSTPSSTPPSITPTGFSTNGGTLDASGVTTSAGIVISATYGVGATSFEKILLANTSASSSGTPIQYSPRIRWSGTAWTGAASQVADFIIENRPVNGSSPITSTLVISSQINGAGYGAIWTLTNAGNLTLAGNLTSLGGGVFLTTSSSLTDGAGSSAGTLTTAPSVGNPTKWIGINDNGTTRYIPAW